LGIIRLFSVRGIPWASLLHCISGTASATARQSLELTKIWNKVTPLGLHVDHYLLIFGSGLDGLDLGYLSERQLIRRAMIRWMCIGPRVCLVKPDEDQQKEQ